MNKVTKYMQYLCYASVLLFTTSCIKDGLDECPPEPQGEYYSYIRFVYDYNMAFEDLFHKQVCHIDLYLFDDNGIYIEKMTDECSAGETFSKDYIMGLPEAYKEVTQFVAFPGARQEFLTSALMEPGISTIGDLETSLSKLKNNNFIDSKLDHFWHGSIAYTRTKVDRNDTTVISLTKNTNTFRIVLQLLDEEEGDQLDINEFDIRLKSANGAYNAYNDITSSTPWSYTPYERVNDKDGITAVAELRTLRLSSSKENRLQIGHINSSEELLDINLNKYLNALKLQEFSSMSLQEYMDREDTYKLIIFLKKAKDPESELKWIAAQISINDWVVRDQNGEL